MHIKLDKKLYEQDKLYGTTTMGARGQVVIPAQARKDLKLKPGDQLVVLGKFGKSLGFVKAEHMEEIIGIIMEQIAGSEMESDVRNHIQKLFGSVTSTFKKTH